MKPTNFVAGETDSGSGPTTSTPGSVMISLTKVRPMSTWPSASIFIAPAPPCASLIFDFICSAMPSFFMASSKLTPAAEPPAGLGKESDCAESSVFFTASDEEISGCRVPGRTARPIATCANGVSLFVTTFPDAITSWYGGCTIGTSNGVPFATCALVPSPEPKVAFTLCPVFFSNAGIICSTPARIPPGAISVISAAIALYELRTTSPTNKVVRIFFIGAPHRILLFSALTPIEIQRQSQEDSREPQCRFQWTVSKREDQNPRGESDKQQRSPRIEGTPERTSQFGAPCAQDDNGGHSH